MQGVKARLQYVKDCVVEGLDVFSNRLAWASDSQDEEGLWVPLMLEGLRTSDKLIDRLSWTVTHPPGLALEAKRQRVLATDRIRGNLLPLCQRFGIDTVSQILLIHRAHTKGREHYVLDPSQAKVYVEDPKSKDIAGIIRSPLFLPTEIYNYDYLLPGASYENTPGLLRRLGDKMDGLFPPDGINPQVRRDSVYHYLTAFQWAFILIHPFYEANGRTSEDCMYLFWRRRPDLKSTMRYLSADGSRTGASIDEWYKVMVEAYRKVLLSFAQSCGIKDQQEQDQVKKYADLERLFHERFGLTQQQVWVRYQSYFCAHLKSHIDSMGNIEFLKGLPQIEALAQNLKDAPREYCFANGAGI